MGEEVRKIPKIRFKGFKDDWEQRKLGEVVQFFSGLTYSPDNVIESGGTFVLRSSNVKNGEIVDADNVYVKSDIVNSDNVQVGDIIVVVRNGSRALIGKHAQIKKKMNDTVIGAFMTGVRSETPNFTNAMLDTQQFNIEINKNLGATINQITIGAFKEMTFYIPIEVVESDQVGALFNRIDNLITLHQRKLDLLKVTKKSMLQKMFPKDGESVPEIRFAGFTDEWEQRKLSELGNIVTGSTPSTNDKLNYDGEFLFVSPADIQGNRYVTETRTTLSEKGFSKGRVLKEGSILFVSIGSTIGKVAQIKEKATTNQQINAIETNDNYDDDFIYSLMEKASLKIKKLAATQAVPIINKTSFGESEVRAPINKNEQAKIGQYFETLDNLITLHQRELDLLKDLKKSMLQQMFI